MISKYTYKKMTWIDLESPSKDEIEQISEEYKLPELVTKEILSPSLRAKVDKYDDFIYMIMYFPTGVQGKQNSYEREIDFIVGKNYIITAHYESIDPLNEFSKQFERNSLLDKNEFGDHAGYLFYYIIKEVYQHVLNELEDMDILIKDVERGIFEGQEAKMVERISLINRALVDFRQSLRFHKETLTSFEHAGKDFFGEEFSYYLNAILGEYNKIENTLSNNKEIMRDLRETNDSLLSTKANDTIKKLTVMNFIMLPLGLITWIFGMNSQIIFIRDGKDFFIVLGAMLLVGFVMFIYFKQKKWF
jgi:magnesium transporter